MEQAIQERLDARQYREAFELLLEQFQGRVHRLAWSMLRDRALAEDTTQEIFIRIWKALPGYRRASSLSTWIYAIARNTCLSAIERRERERGERPLRLETGAWRLEVSASGFRPPASFEDCRDVYVMMARLPEHYRRVLTLFYLEEKSYHQVAEMLGLPMGTVKTQLHRARKQLAAAMQPGPRRGQTFAKEIMHALCRL
jgi:RNA polymerase sigma-70 factor (ECF subfamily)